VTALIYGSNGALVSEGINLGIVFDHARKRGGVMSIEIRWSYQAKFDAQILVRFHDGATAVTYFLLHSHAVNWARTRRDRKGSCWAGCQVVIDGKPDAAIIDTSSTHL